MGKIGRKMANGQLLFQALCQCHLLANQITYALSIYTFLIHGMLLKIVQKRVARDYQLQQVECLDSHLLLHDCCGKEKPVKVGVALALCMCITSPTSIGDR